MAQRQFSSASTTPLCGIFEADGSKQYHYPTIPNLRQPPAAHINHGKHTAEGQSIDVSRIEILLSSAASASSDISYQKHSARSAEAHWSSRTHERTLADGEGRLLAQHGSARSQEAGHGQRRSEITERTSSARVHVQEEQRIDEEEDNDHAVWILFWLSSFDPIHSLFSCLFTLVITFGLLLVSPIRLISKQGSFGDQAIRAIAPLFKNHLRMLHAPSVSYAHEWEFSHTMLIAIHVASPLVSIGVAVAAWVSAAFWVFAVIMGNPDGTERRDDGRDAVLAVRNWWEGFFLMALLPRMRSSMKTSMRSIV